MLNKLLGTSMPIKLFHLFSCVFFLRLPRARTLRSGITAFNSNAIIKIFTITVAINVTHYWYFYSAFIFIFFIVCSQKQPQKEYKTLLKVYGNPLKHPTLKSLSKNFHFKKSEGWKIKLNRFNLLNEVYVWCKNIYFF